MKKADIKLVALVAGGVMLAGWLMNAGKDNDFVASIRDGFGT